MTSPDPDPPRSHATGLVLFGILDIAVGALYLAKTVVFALLAVSGAADSMPPAADRGEIAVTAAVALPVAAFFLAIGFGSIAARRWARALSLAFAGLWLTAGSIATVFLLAWLPRVYAALGSAPARRTGAPRPLALSPELRAYGCVVLVGVLLPGAWFLFYRSGGAREECERRDPQERWTDRVPVSAIATAMILVVGALLAIDLAFSPSRQILFVGHRLGAAARAATAAAGAAELVVAWRLCRLERWAAAAAAAVVAIRGVVDVGLALRVARSGIAEIVRLEPSATAEARDAIARLEPLHLLRVGAAFLAVVALAALAFSIWTAARLPRPRRAANGAGSSP